MKKSVGLYAASTSARKPALSIACQMRRNILRRMRRQELQRLKAAVPRIAHRHHMDEAAIVMEAVKYIDQLHATLLARARSGKISPEVLQRVDLGRIAAMHDMRFTTRTHLSLTQLDMPFKLVPVLPKK